jgi:Zn-dependent alcohol dehydrogenase
VDRLVTHRFPLTRIGEAFAAHRSPESIKVTVVT